MDRAQDMLKKLARDAMFEISDEEMPALIQEYKIFMSYVEALEFIDTKNIEPLAFPYEIETTFLREDEVNHMISCEEALKNAPDVQKNQIKVPKVIG